MVYEKYFEQPDWSTVRDDSRLKGFELGRERGFDEGRRRGLREGLEQGREEGRLEVLREQIAWKFGDSFFLEVNDRLAGDVESVDNTSWAVMHCTTEKQFLSALVGLR